MKFSILIENFFDFLHPVAAHFYRSSNAYYRSLWSITQS